jgi:hypothetical protein
MSHGIDSIAKIFENASVAAFLGAASAFILVVINDWRRLKRRKTHILPAVLKRERLLARSHIDGTTQVRADAAVGKFFENLNLHLASDTIQRHAEELSNQLTERQQMGLHHVASAMKGADELNARAVEMVQRISETNRSVQRGEVRALQDLPKLRVALDQLYGSELILLARAECLIDAYLGDKLNEQGDVR